MSEFVHRSHDSVHHSWARAVSESSRWGRPYLRSTSGNCEKAHNVHAQRRSHNACLPSGSGDQIDFQENDLNEASMVTGFGEQERQVQGTGQCVLMITAHGNEGYATCDTHTDNADTLEKNESVRHKASGRYKAAFQVSISDESFTTSIQRTDDITLRTREDGIWSSMHTHEDYIEGVYETWKQLANTWTKHGSRSAVYITNQHIKRDHYPAKEMVDDKIVEGGITRQPCKHTLESGKQGSDSNAGRYILQLREVGLQIPKAGATSIVQRISQRCWKDRKACRTMHSCTGSTVQNVNSRNPANSCDGYKAHRSSFAA